MGQAQPSVSLSPSTQPWPRLLSAIMTGLARGRGSAVSPSLWALVGGNSFPKSAWLRLRRLELPSAWCSLVSSASGFRCCSHRAASHVRSPRQTSCGAVGACKGVTLGFHAAGRTDGLGPQIITSTDPKTQCGVEGEALVRTPCACCNHRPDHQPGDAPPEPALCGARRRARPAEALRVHGLGRRPAQLSPTLCGRNGLLPVVLRGRFSAWGAGQ